MLGNTDGPAGGADKGQLSEPRDVPGIFASVLIGAGFGLRAPSSVFPSHSQLGSVRAVDGALSICSPFSFPESSDSTEPPLLVLAVLLLLRVLLAVLVRFRSAFPVCGGDARLGETNDMLFRKSR